MDSKKVIEKLVKIAENQQKIINKLAQFANTGLQGDPLDPTLPGDNAKTAPPAAKPPMPGAKPAAPPAAPGGLPPDLKSALDQAVPNLKGALKVTVNGKNLSVAFNADKVKDHPSDLKKKMEGALGGAYTVSDILGYTNPAWKANY